MNFGGMKDGATDIKGFYGGRASVTAGGSGDNAEIDGGWIDRKGFSWAKLLISYSAVFAAAGGGNTLAVAANLQDAVDAAGTGAADFGDALSSAVQATGESGGSTETGVVALHFDLTDAERYIRAQVTPNLAAAGVDTSEVSFMLVLGGYIAGPADTPVN